MKLGFIEILGTIASAIEVAGEWLQGKKEKNCFDYQLLINGSKSFSNQLCISSNWRAFSESSFGYDLFKNPGSGVQVEAFSIVSVKNFSTDWR